MAATVYDAFRIHGDGSKTQIGTIAITKGALSIVTLIKESDRSDVQASLDEFNNRPFLVEKAPPTGDSHGRYGLGAVEYKRGKPGFDEVLIRKLESGRQIQLKPRGL